MTLSVTPSALSRPLLGLNTLMREAFSGRDLGPLGAELIARNTQAPDDASALLDLSIVLQLRGDRELGLAVQAQAMQLRRDYWLPASQSPARLRLLVIKGPGDLMANTPIECLLADSDVELHVLMLHPDDRLTPSLADMVPPHDLLFVAVGESEANQPLLGKLADIVANWPTPVINRPEHIALLSRTGVAALLHDLPACVVPPIVRCEARLLHVLAADPASLHHELPGLAYPCLVRPVDSHAGHDLEQVADAAALATYAARLAPQPEAPDAPAFFLSPFVDYRSPDGQYRKYRIAVINGVPYPCHLAISSHWMVHYLNADMDLSADKRAEEADFMARFSQEFGLRHALVFAEMAAQLQLEYFAVDCAETPDGELLVFEVDSSMVVHALDPEALYPYKRPAMQALFAAFRRFLGHKASTTIAS